MNLEEFAGQGAENITARDAKLPILKILYSNSPVLDESDGKFWKRQDKVTSIMKSQVLYIKVKMVLL